MSDDLYANYAELSANEVQGVDYEIYPFPVPHSKCIALTPHGGGIEVGCSEVVRGLHERFGFSAYDFDSMKTSNNATMHITSVNFDEPIAVDMMSKAFHSVSIHGYADDLKNTVIGGLDTVGIANVAEELQKAGFNVDVNAPAEIAGVNPKNIINRNLRGIGIQLELSTAQRKAFFTNGNWSRSNRGNVVQEFYDFVDAIGRAMMRGYSEAPLRIKNPSRVIQKRR